MKKLLLLCGFTLSSTCFSDDTIPYYANGLCNEPGFECHKVSSGESWEKLFPDEKQRDIVQRINRTYNSIWAGKVIAIPKNLANSDILDFAPFPKNVSTIHEKEIIVDQDKLAWGAYDDKGQLVNWGPIASGRKKCPDSNRVCLTMTGVFRVFDKQDQRCVSDIFPIGKGGAKMPFCMFFHKGFALHGSQDIPGYRASHGCVRMFIRDAKWLNENFVVMADEKAGLLGTKVIVKPVTWSDTDHEKNA